MSILAIDLKTNYLPGDDFFFIESFLIKQDEKKKVYYWQDAARGDDDFLAGARIVEWRDLDNGSYLMVTKILDDHGRPVAMRRTIIDLRENEIFTVLMSRG